MQVGVRTYGKAALGTLLFTCNMSIIVNVLAVCGIYSLAPVVFCNGIHTSLQSIDLCS